MSPAELAGRFDGILETVIRLTRQILDDHLEYELPNRPCSWRVLMHHVFQIPIAFLDMEERSETLTYETMIVPLPENLKASSDIATYGETVRSRF